MKWLVRVFLGLAALAGVFALVGILLPGTARVERSVLIDRPPATLYALLSRLQTYYEWSPWSRIDPNAEFMFEGPEFGEDARMIWRSAHPQVGSGAMQIIDTESNARVDTIMTYEGWGDARGAWIITRQGGGTEVTWTFETSFGLDVVRRFNGLTFDRRIGDDYEQGLMRLKSFAEELGAADFSDVPIEEVTTEAIPVVYQNGRVRADSAGQAAAFATALASARRFLAAERLTPSGPAIAITTAWEPPLWEFKAAVPYAERARPSTPGAREGFTQTFGGQALKLVHDGAPEDLAPLYAKLDAYIDAHRLERAGDPWEVHVTDRALTAPSQQVTEIYVPVK